MVDKLGKGAHHICPSQFLQSLYGNICCTNNALENGHDKDKRLLDYEKPPTSVKVKNLAQKCLLPYSRGDTRFHSQFPRQSNHRKGRHNQGIMQENFFIKCQKDLDAHDEDQPTLLSLWWRFGAPNVPPGSVIRVGEHGLNKVMVASAGEVDMTSISAVRS